MHPESEHGLRVQLATALRERDEARASTQQWLSVVEKLRENLNATLLERDALKESLAAARSECEVREAAHRYCLYMFSREWLTDAANRNSFAAQVFKILDAALASPAAGDPK